MSVYLQTRIDGQLYQYNAEALRADLAALNVEPAAIQAILDELAGGSADALAGFDLDHHLVPLTGDGLPPGDLDVDDLQNADARLGEAFNFLEVMLLMHQAAKELREAGREMRHADRDIAMAQQFAAADKTRSSALFNLIFGVVSGAINIAMGAVSVVSAGAQLGKMRTPQAEFKAAKLEMDAAKADQNLAQAQVDLGKAEAKLQDLKGATPPDAAKIKAAEADVAAARTEVQKCATAAQTATESQVKALDKEIDSARTELKKLEDLPDTPENQAKIDSANKELTILLNDRSALETKIDTLYKNPTDPAQLDTAAVRLAEARFNTSEFGPVGERFAAAQQRLADATQKMQTVNNMIMGLKMGSDGLSQALQGVGGFLAAEQQAQGSELGAEAEASKSKEQEAAEFQQAFNDMLQQVQNLVKECLQAQNQANSSIYQNM